MADSEQTPEERAEELRVELEVLDEFEAERLARAQAAREADRARGRARAEELFPEGSLGRVRQDVSPELETLINERQAALDELRASDPASRRAEELRRVTSEFDELIAARTDPRNRANIAERERGVEGIQRQTAQQLRRVSGLSNESGTRLNLGLVSDVLQSEAQARGNLERDLLISGREAAEGLTREAASARSASLKELESVEAAKRKEIADAQARLEDLQGAIEQDILNRQVFNIQARREEQFGRLATEEGEVGLGAAERLGEREILLAQSNQVEQRNQAQESLEIQRIEAEKPPPSGGGGKSLLCIQFWMTGDISDAVLKGDFMYTIGNDAISENVRLTYYMWSSWIAPHIYKRGWLYKALRPHVMAWSHEMAARAGVEEAQSNWLGKAWAAVGVPVHEWVGRALTWCGYTFEDYDASSAVNDIKSNAQDLWVEAHEEMGIEGVA